MRRPCFYTPTGNQPGHTYAAHSNIHQFHYILPKGRPEIYKYFLIFLNLEFCLAQKSDKIDSKTHPDRFEPA